MYQSACEWVRGWMTKWVIESVDKFTYQQLIQWMYYQQNVITTNFSPHSYRLLTPAWTARRTPCWPLLLLSLVVFYVEVKRDFEAVPIDTQNDILNDLSEQLGGALTSILLLLLLLLLLILTQLNKTKSSIVWRINKYTENLRTMPVPPCLTWSLRSISLSFSVSMLLSFFKFRHFFEVPSQINTSQNMAPRFRVQVDNWGYLLRNIQCVR